MELLVENTAHDTWSLVSLTSSKSLEVELTVVHQNVFSSFNE